MGRARSSRPGRQPGALLLAFPRKLHSACSTRLSGRRQKRLAKDRRRQRFRELNHETLEGRLLLACTGGSVQAIDDSYDIELDGNGHAFVDWTIGLLQNDNPTQATASEESPPQHGNVDVYSDGDDKRDRSNYCRPEEDPPREERQLRSKIRPVPFKFIRSGRSSPRVWCCWWGESIPSGEVGPVALG